METPVYPDLKDQCIVITGGASGIGEALVRAFALQDAYVCFCDVQLEAGRQLDVELGEKVSFAHVDLTESSQVISWIADVGRRHETIKALLNNAAQDKRIPLQETTMEQWDQLMRLNLRASYLCTQQAVPYMKKNAASVINFGSINFQLGGAGLSAYVTAKGGIVAMSRSLARELGPDNIRVNTLSPGWVMTDKQLQLYVDDDVKKEIFADQCVPVLIDPGEIAEVALFLASDVSRAITGQNIAADRGWRHL